MLGRTLVSFLSKNRALAVARRRQQSHQQQQTSTSTSTDEAEAPLAAAAAAAAATSSNKKRSRREYEEEEEEGDEWGMVEEHVPFHVASSSSSSSSSAMSTRAPTPYRPAPEPPAPATAAEEELDAEVVFDRKVMEILEATEKAAAAAEAAGRARRPGREEDRGDVIVLPPLLKRHKPAPGSDEGMLYLGASDPEVFVSFDDIFSSSGGKEEAKEAHGAAGGEKDEEGSNSSSTHSSPLFPRTTISRPRPASSADATTAISSSADERPSSSTTITTTASHEPPPTTATGGEWNNAWAAALGLPAPSAVVFRGTVGHKALASPALFPSWAEQQEEEEGGLDAKQKEAEEDDEDDYLFGKPKPEPPPPVRPRGPTEPSIWERAEPLVNCSVSLGPEGCRTRAGPATAARAASWGMGEGTDLAWDVADLHSVTLYRALDCLGGRALLSVCKSSLRPPWCAPRLDVVALPIDLEEGRNAAGLEALAAFLTGEAAKRARAQSSHGQGQGFDVLGSSLLDARALLSAKVRVVPSEEAHTRPELPHLVELVGGFGKGGKAVGGGGGGGAKAKRD